MQSPAVVSGSPHDWISARRRLCRHGKVIEPSNGPGSRDDAVEQSAIPLHVRHVLSSEGFPGTL